MQEEWTQDDLKTHMEGGYVRPKPAPRPCLDVLTIELPIPDKATHPNSRSRTYHKAARAKKKQREDAHIAMLATLRCERLTAPCWNRATIQATFHKPGNRAKRGDTDNYVAWLKATADGLEDARVILDDQGLVWLPPIELLGKDAGEERKLVLVITKLE